MSLLLLPMVSEADAKGNTDAVKNTTLKPFNPAFY